MRRVFRERAARRRFARLARLRETLSRPGLALIFGYSVKTNPRAELMALAREHGCFAEVISREELAWARRCGFTAAATIANGPEPVDPQSEPLAYAFADSVEAFRRNAERGVAAVHGVRLRPARIGSRFGVPAGDEAALRAAIAALHDDRPLAVSFHVRPGDYHGATWRDVAGDVLRRALALERDTGRPVVAFDVGGGLTPAEFDARFGDDAAWLVARLRAELPRCAVLIAEPGQAVATPAEALVADVLEVRERAAAREVIVDAGYPEWSQMHGFVHRLYVERGGRWRRLRAGSDRLGGRTCLEYDLVDGIAFPAGIAPGDRLLVADCGAYDASMAFDFARGEVR